MFRWYKEIWFGVAMGICMWMLDALMHTTQHNEFTWSAFGQEIGANDSNSLIFRSMFVIVSIGLGSSLWRSNQRRNQITHIQSLLSALRRQIGNPSLLIVEYAQMLHLREGWPVGRDSIQIIQEIQANAQKITNAVECLPSPLTVLEEAETRTVKATREEVSVHDR
ncbi:MAG: hypothetical protein HY231_16895 [Acidobacteria bacterium]|nr:hypothetical protein [Acidobacteriota bacterium]